MSKVLSIALLMGLVFCSPTLVRADEPSSPEKDKDIKTLLELSGAAKMEEQVFNAVMAQMRKMHPEIPAEFWEEFSFSKEVDYNEVMTQMVPVYSKHFTAAEIKDLIKFYESPIGKKLVKEQPEMIREAMQIGQKWGNELGLKVSKKMIEKGLLKP